MLVVPRPQLRAIFHRTRGNQCIRDFHAVAQSVLSQPYSGPMPRFFPDRGARQRTEKVVQSVMLMRPGACPQFRHTHRRIEHGSVGVAQLHPSGYDIRISAARDFDQNVGIDKNGHPFRGPSFPRRSKRPLRRRLRTYRTASFSTGPAGPERSRRVPTNSCIAFLCSSRGPR
jgi:hypothetical protein